MNDDLSGRIADLEHRVAAIEARMKLNREPPRDEKTKPMSLREFVLSKGPKTKVDTALVIGFHLEKFSRVSPFNLEDLAKGFASAKEPLPANPSDLLYQNVRRGFMMESEGKKGGSKAWNVTNSGERFVVNGLKAP